MSKLTEAHMKLIKELGVEDLEKAADEWDGTFTQGMAVPQLIRLLDLVSLDACTDEQREVAAEWAVTCGDGIDD